MAETMSRTIPVRVLTAPAYGDDGTGRAGGAERFASGLQASENGVLERLVVGVGEHGHPRRRGAVVSALQRVHRFDLAVEWHHGKGGRAAYDNLDGGVA